MCGARFAVLARRARVLPSPSQATRNLSFLEVFTGAVTLLCQVVVSLGLVRVGLNFPLIGKRTNKHGHMAVVREHVL